MFIRVLASHVVARPKEQLARKFQPIEELEKEQLDTSKI